MNDLVREKLYGAAVYREETAESAQPQPSPRDQAASGPGDISHLFPHLDGQAPDGETA